MKYWIVTDTHFAHDKIRDFCGRPEGFEFKILNALAKAVKPEDILIHLGDICWGDQEKWHTLLEQHAPCKRWLVRGNHDKNTDTWYLSHGWHWVGMSCTIRMFGGSILFSHKPLIDNGFTWNIHGHFHANPVTSWERELVMVLTDKHILLALETSNYQPIELKSAIDKHAKNLSKTKL